MVWTKRDDIHIVSQDWKELSKSICTENQQTFISTQQRFLHSKATCNKYQYSIANLHINYMNCFKLHEITQILISSYSSICIDVVMKLTVKSMWEGLHVNISFTLCGHYWCNCHRWLYYLSLCWTHSIQFATTK